MKRRLQGLYWQGILITLLMALAALGVTAWMKIEDTRSHLTAMLEAGVQWTRDSNDDLQKLAEDIARISPSMDVTFLLDSGLVLADSGQEVREADLRSDREIAAARRGETGRDLRMSPSGASCMLYMARMVSPQLILRLGCPVFGIAGALAGYGILLLTLFLVLYWLQRRGISRFARDQIRQFEDIRRLLDGEIPEVQAVFPELQPSLDAISYRIRRLQEDHQEILRTLNLRNDFVANASHELRSPLTSVRGFAEMLEEGMADTPEEKALCLQTIRSECDRMLAVIEDILRLGRAERKKAADVQIRAAAPVAREILQALRPQAEKKKISLSAEGNTLLRADEKDLWEILYNLTDNAIRYGRENGMVRIRMEESRITVEDDGIGIGGEHIGHIFEQFYRVDETRGSGGTGLGLSIVRAVVERLGGTIAVESSPGEGSRFVMEFPAPADEGDMHIKKRKDAPGAPLPAEE